MKCPVCSSEVKDLYNLNSETDEFKCYYFILQISIAELGDWRDKRIGMNNTFKLGRSIAQIVPFYRHIKEKEIFTNKILIIMGIVAIAKIAVFLLWLM